MAPTPKAPPVYKPKIARSAAPPVYLPHPAIASSAQLKPSNNIRLETRPAPAVYRPQRAGASATQRKPRASSGQPETGACYRMPAVIQRALSPSVVRDFYLDAYDNRMGFRPRADVGGIRQGIHQNWTNAFFQLENALDRNRRGEIDFASVLPHYRTLRDLGNQPTVNVSAEETEARAIHRAMNDAFAAWDGTLATRGVFLGRGVSAEVIRYLRVIANQWTFSDSRTTGVSFHRTRGDSPHTFIYHLG